MSSVVLMCLEEVFVLYRVLLVYWVDMQADPRLDEFLRDVCLYVELCISVHVALHLEAVHSDEARCTAVGEARIQDCSARLRVSILMR